MEHGVTPDQSSMSDSGSFQGSLRLPETDSLRRFVCTAKPVTRDTLLSGHPVCIGHFLRTYFSVFLILNNLPHLWAIAVSPEVKVHLGAQTKE